MNRFLLTVALLAGCGAIERHPFTSVAIANTTLVVGAGVCAAECDPGALRGTSEGVLVGELALSSLAVVWFAEGLIAYATER